MRMQHSPDGGRCQFSRADEVANPAGRAFDPTIRDFKVFEVWESEQHARNFGERLKPILQKYKIELPHEPRPQPVKNTIKGKSL